MQSTVENTSKPRTIDPVGVAFLEASFVVGGAERIEQSIINGLDRSVFKPIVCALREPGAIGLEMEASGVPLYTNIANGWFDTAGVRRLASILRENDVRVLHTTNTPWPMLFGRLACWLAGVPSIVVAVHSTGYQSHSFRRTWGCRILSPVTTRFITLADTHRRYFSRQAWTPARRIAIIRNGVDAERFSRENWPDDARAQMDIPPGAKVAGIVAALRPEKRHDVFLNAARIVSAQEPNALFLIVGDGPERPRVEQMVRDLGLENNVRLTGRLDKPALAMKALDVQILCSDDVVETAPVALLEASSMGVPVISTRVGSVHEQVTDGETGLLIPRDDPGALADAVLRIFRDPELARGMGEAGRKLMLERFTVQNMVRQYGNLFAELAGIEKPAVTMEGGAS